MSPVVCEHLVLRTSDIRALYSVRTLYETTYCLCDIRPANSAALQRQDRVIFGAIVGCVSYRALTEYRAYMSEHSGVWCVRCRECRAYSCGSTIFCIYEHYVRVAALCSVHTGRQRPMGCLIFTGQFPQKSPITSGFFAENDLRHSMGPRLPVHDTLMLRTNIVLLQGHYILSQHCVLVILLKCFAQI